MKILVIGGHFSPALGVINALPKNTSILYVGRKHALEGDTSLSLEYQTITEKGIPFQTITTGRFQRKWTKHTIPSLLKIPQGLLQAFRIIRTFQPTVILGFGGYLQFPITIIGFLSRIPIVIHEQTFGAGLANRLSAPFANTIGISFSSSRTYFPQNKTVLTGNPAVTKLFTKSKAQEPHKIPIITIVGGSLGSHSVNAAVENILAALVEKYIVYHQTGDAKEYNDFDRLLKKREQLPPALQKRYTVVKFIEPEDFIHVINRSDLVISRAGINTITTLLVLHKPSLIIPLPVSQQNEQVKNAEYLQQQGLGIVIPQQQLTAEKFLTSIHAMINQLADYRNADSTNLAIHKNAAEKIVEILTYVEKNTSQKKTS